jgi:hypothetical protein
VLLEEQLACVLSGPGQPDRKVIAETPQLIVPAAGTKRQRQVGQVGVLLAEQLCNQIRGDLIFSARHTGNRSFTSDSRPDNCQEPALCPFVPSLFARRRSTTANDANQ